ncbi:RluA family pseudouridine synthase [Oscillospiraceae bacterium MB08-C2-2]|nr:RluA family pseudouridine synthase [Oscillospiraceae bacterium MB08-C2-2]
MKEFHIQSNDAGQRLDKFLHKAVPLLPTSLMQKYLRLKRIKIDGKRAAGSDRLVVGSVVSLYISDEFFQEQTVDFRSAPSDLDVVYEDDQLLIINKQPGLLVHEGDGHDRDTLIMRILHYLYKKNEYIPDLENSFTPALCNRIDRNTGGLVIAAKTFEALQIMNQKIKDREITKLYLCIVHGVPTQKSALLKGYHTKDSATNTVRISKAPVPGAKTALTSYRVLAVRKDLSLLEIKLLTGRTHQIRAHMASIGHPLLGDTKYGVNRMNRDSAFQFQALCAYKLILDFPTDAGPLNYLKGKSFSLPSVPMLEQGGFGGVNLNTPGI